MLACCSAFKTHTITFYTEISLFIYLFILLYSGILIYALGYLEEMCLPALRRLSLLTNVFLTHIYFALLHYLCVRTCVTV